MDIAGQQSQHLRKAMIMSLTNDIPAPTRDAELIRLAGIALPLNWDELGSSAKDLWQERQARVIRRDVPTEVFLPLLDTAAEAWRVLYNARVLHELAWEASTGVCSACGERLDDGGDHDDDTEEAQELGQAARAGEAGVFVTTKPGSDIPMAYAVAEWDGKWKATFGPW